MQINCDVERYINDVIKESEYRLLFEDLVVVDAGCNIGTFSLWIYPLAKKIYALDIVEKNINNFKKTIEENKLDKIEVFNCGLSGKTEVRNYKSELDDGDGSAQLTDINSNSIIQTYSLSDFLEANKIDHVDVLKLDVEGLEKEILTSPFPSDRVNCIVGENHGTKDLDVIFERLGYRFINRGNKFVARK